MSEPLISVLMPAYNHERYVEAAIRSVMDQEFPRIELLVVDDGSKDGTWNILRRLRVECERRFERVEMETQSNQGTCVTMNRLCSLAKGDFALVLASDDALLPGALRHLSAPMLEDVGIGVTVGRNELMDGEGRTCYWDADRHTAYEKAAAKYETFDAFLAEATGIDAFGDRFGDYRELVKVNHVGNGALLRKSVLDRVLPFTTEAPLEDWWLHLQLAKLTRYRMVGERTFRYRWHDANNIKRDDRMTRFFWETMAWEEQRVESLADRRWCKAFAEVRWEVRRKFGIGPWLTLDKVIALREVRKVLTVFGLEFVLQRQARNLI